MPETGVTDPDTEEEQPYPASLLCSTAGIVVVGDEILSGRIHDSNAMFLLREFRDMGWGVAKARETRRAIRSAG